MESIKGKWWALKMGVAWMIQISDQKREKRGFWRLLRDSRKIEDLWLDSLSSFISLNPFSIVSLDLWFQWTHLWILVTFSLILWVAKSHLLRVRCSLFWTMFDWLGTLLMKFHFYSFVVSILNASYIFGQFIRWVRYVRLVLERGISHVLDLKPTT